MPASSEAREFLMSRRERLQPEDVGLPRGTKVVHHPEVGELRLRYGALEVVGMPGTRLFGYTPDPDNPATRDALRLLAMVPVEDGLRTSP